MISEEKRVYKAFWSDYRTQARAAAEKAPQQIAESIGREVFALLQGFETRPDDYVRVSRVHDEYTIQLIKAVE